MFTTVRTRPALHQRVKLIIVAALFTLSLIAGVTTSAQPVGATRVCYKDPGKGMVCTVIK